MLLALLVGGLWALASPQARDLDGRYAQDPSRKAWFDALRSGRGACCADFDGHPPEAIWDTGEGDNHSYRVMLDGKWWDVPEDAVLDVKNRYGQAVVWFYWQTAQDGSRTPYIRCFLPGALI